MFHKQYDYHYQLEHKLISLSFAHTRIGHKAGDHLIAPLRIVQRHLQASGHLWLTAGHGQPEAIGDILASVQRTVGAVQQILADIAALGVQLIGYGNA